MIRRALGPALLLGAVAAMAALGDLGDAVMAFLGCYAVAFAGYLLGLRAAPSLRWVLGVALAARLLLVFLPPGLSDDIWRYLWEGRVQREMGFAAPFLHAPNTEALAEIRDEVQAKVNHAEVPAAYPPASQLFFYATGALHYGPGSLKLWLLLAELLAIWLLWLALRERGHGPERLAIYAWNPLAIVELAGNGHLEALGVATLAAALLADARGRSGGTGAALSLGVMVKLVPAPLLPFAAPDLRGLLRAAVAAIAVATLLALPFLLDGVGAAVTEGTSNYATRWRFNESLFALIAWPFGAAGEVSGITTPKRIIAGIYGGLVLVLWLLRWRAPDRWPLARVGLWLMTAYLLLAPTVHPWYLLWALPFAAFFPAPAVLCLSATLPLSYWVLIDYRASGVWEESLVVRLVEYLPVYGLLLWSAVTRLTAPGGPRDAPATATAT